MMLPYRDVDSTGEWYNRSLTIAIHDGVSNGDHARHLSVALRISLDGISAACCVSANGDASCGGANEYWFGAVA